MDRGPRGAARGLVGLWASTLSKMDDLQVVDLYVATSS